MGAKNSNLGSNENKEPITYTKIMSPCFGSCPLDVEFQKITYEGKDFQIRMSKPLVQETLKYGK